MTSCAWNREGTLASRVWNIQEGSSVCCTHVVSERRIGFLKDAMKCAHKECNISIQDMTYLRLTSDVRLECPEIAAHVITG